LPYGYEVNPQGSVNNYKFTGFEHDAESQLDHAFFRQYSARLGRWMSPDPSGLAAVDPSNPQTWNRYAYVMNSPINYIDPLGLMTICYWENPGDGGAAVLTECISSTGGGGGGEPKMGGGGGGGKPCLKGAGPLAPGQSRCAVNDEQNSCIPRNALSFTARTTLSVLSWAAKRSGGVRAVGFGASGALAQGYVGGGASVQALLIADYLGQQGFYLSVSGGYTAGEAGNGGILGAQYMTSWSDKTAIVQDVVESSVSYGAAVGKGFAIGWDWSPSTSVTTTTIGGGFGGFGGAHSLNVASGFIPICHE
jgi:RHS repeat-associated protein